MTVSTYRAAHMRRRFRPFRSVLARALAAMLGVASLAPSVFAVGEAQSPATGAWQYLRPQFYGDREIGVVDEKFMRLEAPANTPDPSATPLTLRFGPQAAGRIKQVRLIIDNNPSPLAATMRVEARRAGGRNRSARAHRPLHLGARDRGNRRRTSGNAQHLGESQRRLFGAAECERWRHARRNPFSPVGGCDRAADEHPSPEQFGIPDRPAHGRSRFRRTTFRTSA